MSVIPDQGEEGVREPTNTEEPAPAEMSEGSEREPTNTESVREPTNEG